MSKSPFPGMDPYLEGDWQQLAITLPVFLSEELNRILPAGLASTIRRREVPDPRADELRRMLSERGKSSREIGPVHQYFLEIVNGATRADAITCIELIHPSNQLVPGQDFLYAKLQEIRLTEGVNVVEIDLTRYGDRLKVLPQSYMLPDQPTYATCIRRANRSKVEMYPCP